MNPNDVVDQTQETLDWSVKNGQVPLVASICFFIILCGVLWIAFKVLIADRNKFDAKCENWDKTLKKAQELQANQQEVILQQQGVIADQQAFITDQQAFFTEQKKSFDEQKEMMSSINLNVKDINNKVDLVLRKER